LYFKLYPSSLAPDITECTHARDIHQLLPTFRRGSSASTIDYLYASPILHQSLQTSDTEFISSQWTDHAILTATFQFKSSRQGPGLWRAHPHLATNPFFKTALFEALDAFHLEQSTNLPISAQIKWDQLKALIKPIAQRIGRQKKAWQLRHIARLQRKPNKLLRKYKITHIIQVQLPAIESMIASLQHDLSETIALRAGKRWRENGEKSAGYLKRTIATRAIKKTIPSLLHPITKEGAHSPAELDSAVSTFYRELYTTQPISTPDVEQLISTILPEDRISISVHDLLQRPFTMSEISEGTNRCPNKSSPGKDGLPYEILSLLLTHVATAQLALQIYNDALQLAIFPASWCSTCVCLLPKKGDLKELRNWRPISLINTDAKVFTRLLNARLMPQFANKISRQQLGFMPNRFIAEHDLQLSTIKMIAQHQKSQHYGEKIGC
jgi:hypothetical protein